MATINATISAAAQTYGKPKTISASDLQTRVVPALRDLFGPLIGAPDPVTGIPTYTDRTDAQVLDEWSRRTYQQLNQSVKDYERKKAAQTAADGVADVALTD